MTRNSCLPHFRHIPQCRHSKRSIVVILSFSSVGNFGTPELHLVIIDPDHDSTHMSFVRPAFDTVYKADVLVASRVRIFVPGDEPARKRFVTKSKLAAGFINCLGAAFEANVIPIANVRFDRGRANRAELLAHFANSPRTIDSNLSQAYTLERQYTISPVFEITMFFG